MSVDELIVGVRIALGQLPIGDCPRFDQDADETITIDELVIAVRSALDDGCAN